MSKTEIDYHKDLISKNRNIAFPSLNIPTKTQGISWHNFQHLNVNKIATTNNSSPKDYKDYKQKRILEAPRKRIIRIGDLLKQVYQHFLLQFLCRLGWKKQHPTYSMDEVYTYFLNRNPIHFMVILERPE